jgi:hypothetical protein
MLAAEGSRQFHLHRLRGRKSVIQAGARLAGPAAVTVHDQPDVLGELSREDLATPRKTGFSRVD